MIPVVVVVMAMTMLSLSINEDRQVQILPTCTAFRSSTTSTLNHHHHCNNINRSHRSIGSITTIKNNRHSSTIDSSDAGTTAVAFLAVRGSNRRVPSKGGILSSLPVSTTTSLAAVSTSGNNDDDGSMKKKKRKSKATAGKTKKSRTKKTVTAEKSTTVKSRKKTPAVAVAESAISATTGKQDNADTVTDIPPPSSPEEVGPIVMTASELAIIQREKELQIQNDKAAAILASTSPEGLYYGPRLREPDVVEFDVTGGRPGAIIESEADLERKAIMFDELATGKRKYDEPWFDDYGYQEQEIGIKYNTDDPDAIVAETIGRYDVTDLKTKFDWEWNPETDPDPNAIPTNEGRYLTETEKDEEGIEVGWDPAYGPSNPIDERAKVGFAESYMIDIKTRDEKLLTPQFHPGDLEIAFNEEIVQYRKSLDIIETYTDEFLPPEIRVPKTVAKWIGYPEMRYPPKNFTNNRFTPPDKMTNFDELTPFRARQKAVELARAKNAEWLPVGASHSWHEDQRRPYEKCGTLVGTLRPGKIDEEIKELIEPALLILGSCAILLSMEGEDNTVFRFHYHGLMKNKVGMEAWTETLIRDCGANVTGVVFETGFRARDPWYDGGDPYHGWN